MTSPQATKLRLLYKRATHAFDLAKTEKERAWLAYMKQMRAEGFCPSCEKALQDCKCVLMAQLPESEGPSSEAITSIATSGLPARQSGSPEGATSGERQCQKCDKTVSDVERLGCHTIGCEFSMEVLGKGGIS
jgi:hypothetical protein